ncbi:hypothetical protein HDU78_001222, partial [Chytriomyces hyalinus]
AAHLPQAPLGLDCVIKNNLHGLLCNPQINCASAKTSQTETYRANKDMRPRVSMSEVHSYNHALQQQQQQQQADADEAAAGLSPAERHVLDKATASYPRRIPSPLASPILPSNMQRHIGNNMPSPEDGPTHWNQPNYHHSHHPPQQQQQPNQTIPRHTLTHSRPVNIITPRYSPYSGGHRRSVDVNDRLASLEQRLNCSVAIVASSPPYSNVGGQTHLERRSMPQIGSSSSSPLENTRMRGYSNPQPVHSHSQQYPQPVRTLSIPSSAISHHHPSVVHHPIRSIQSAQSVQPYPQQNNTHSYASSQRIQQQPQYVQPSFVYATTTQNHSIGPQQQPYDSHHHQQQQQQRPPIILPASHHYPQQQPYVLVQSEPMYIASQEGYPVYSNPSQQQQQPESGRSFQCDQCDLTFTRKHDMNRHIRSVHAVQAGEALFACGICGQGFGRVDSLKRHVNICRSAK